MPTRCRASSSTRWATRRPRSDSLQSALDHARRAGAKYEESLYLANLADHYLKQGDYATALRYAQAALPLTRELKNLGGETVALANIGLAQIALHDIEAGKRHLRASIDIDERRGSITGVSDSYAEMGQYLERAGDARGAIEAWHQHRALAGQILARDQQQAILEMQEQFDAERRARELALLQRDGEHQDRGSCARASCSSAWAGWSRPARALAVGVVLIGVQRVRQANRQLAHSNALLQRAGRDRPAHRPGQPAPLAGGDAPAGRRRQLQRHRASWPTWTTSSASTTAMAMPPATPCWCEVAQRLRSALRDADLIVRWGGEEFLVVVRALGRRRGAGAGAAHARRDRRRALSSTRAGRSRITASIGYATFPIEPSLLAVSTGSAPSAWSTPPCTWPRRTAATAPMACACCVRATRRSSRPSAERWKRPGWPAR